MKKDYRNEIKVLNKNELINYIEYYANFVIMNCDNIDVTRAMKMLSYAKNRLKLKQKTNTNITSALPF